MTSKDSKPIQRLLSNVDVLGQSVETLHALTNPLRLKMLAVIHNHGEINVKNLYARMGIEQSLASQQLKFLRNTDIVNTRCSGQYIFYSLNYEYIYEIAKSLEHLTL